MYEQVVSLKRESRFQHGRYNPDATKCNWIPEKYFVFIEKSSLSVFTTQFEWTKKFLLKPFSVIIKRQLLQVKNFFHLLKPFYTLCRWSSKLKYILPCNEGIIKMWSHKRESDYNHYNRCLVYTSDCITSCRAKLWYMPLPPTADNNVDASWEVKSSRILYLWTIWCPD